MAKAVKYMPAPRGSNHGDGTATSFPKWVKGTKTRGLDVHVIDSWDGCGTARPVQRALPYRLHPSPHAPGLVPVRKQPGEHKKGIKYTEACLNCSAAVKRSPEDKEHCLLRRCPLHLYPENKRPYMRTSAGSPTSNGRQFIRGEITKQATSLHPLSKADTLRPPIFDEAHNGQPDE